MQKLGSKPITIGASPEFQTRAQGLIGLEKVYGLKASQVTYKALDTDGPLDQKTLLKLDTEVQVQKLDPTTVANQWLQSVGLGS